MQRQRATCRPESEQFRLFSGKRASYADEIGTSEKSTSPRFVQGRFRVGDGANVGEGDGVGVGADEGGGVGIGVDVGVGDGGDKPPE
jgi:hypothetical protein